MKTALVTEIDVRPIDEAILTALHGATSLDRVGGPMLIGIRNMSGVIYRQVECANAGEFVHLCLALDQLGLCDEPMNPNAEMTFRAIYG